MPPAHPLPSDAFVLKDTHLHNEEWGDSFCPCWGKRQSHLSSLEEVHFQILSKCLCIWALSTGSSLHFFHTLTLKLLLLFLATLPSRERPASPD
jgi:hypothetical protein